MRVMLCGTIGFLLAVALWAGAGAYTLGAPPPEGTPLHDYATAIMYVLTPYSTLWAVLCGVLWERIANK